MTKRLIALLLAAMMILCAGCKGKQSNDAALAETQPGTTEAPVPTETLHPALADNPFDDADYTEPAAETEEVTEPAEETETATEAATEAATEPAKETEAPTEPEATEDDGEMTYEKFMAMSATEQQAFINSFPTIEAFFEWFNAAKEAYEASRNEVEIGDGSFDIGDLINGSN